jgi:hypothetical protein
VAKAHKMIDSALAYVPPFIVPSEFHLVPLYFSVTCSFLFLLLQTTANPLRNHRQTIIDENNCHKNLRCRFKDYELRDEMLKLVYNPASLEERDIGPFVIQ